MNDNVAIRIVGDASGVAPAIDRTKSEIGSIAPLLKELNATMAALTSQMKAGFEQGALGAKELKSSVDSVNHSAHEAQVGLTGMVHKIHEGAESVRTFQMRAKEFAELYVGIFAVESIHRWAESLGEAAEQTAKLSAIMGMSIPQVQGLSAAAQMSGTNIEILSKALAIFDSKAVMASGESNAAGKSFKAMGISANDGTTNMQRLLKVADQFHNMADGPTKTALAMQLFGKSGKEMVPFLNQGSEAIQQLIDKSKEYGVENEHAVEVGGRLAESVNESKVAWMGLKNTLTEAFAPMLTELVDGFDALVKGMHDSYESGGLVKVIFDAIAEVGHALVEVTTAIGDGFNEVFRSTSGAGVDWGGVMKAVIDSVVVACKGLIVVAVAMGDGISLTFHLAAASAEWFLEKFVEITGGIRVAGTALGEFMKVVGKVCADALTLNWGAIASDWSNGMEGVRKAVAAKADEVIGEARRMHAGVAAEAAAAARVSASFDAFYKKMDGPAGASSEKPFKFKFGGGIGDAPDLSKTPKEKKEKQPKDDLVQRLEEELEAKKTAWAMEQDAQGTAQAYSLESEADYWKQILQRTDLSAKDRLAIEQKYLAAHSQLIHKRWTIEEDGYKESLADAEKNESAKLVLAQKHLAEVERMFGKESAEYAAAQKDIVAIKRAATQQIIELDKLRADAAEKANLDEVMAAEEAAKFRVQMGVETDGRLIDEERNFENQRYQIQLQAAQRALSVVDPSRDPVKYQQINNQIEALEGQHQLKLTQIDQQAALQRTAIERNAIGSIASSWGSAIGKMMTGQATFVSTVRSMFIGLQQAIGNALGQMIQNWLTRKLSALLISKAADTSAAAAETAHAAATTAAKLASITSITTATISSNAAMAASNIAASKATAAAVIPTQIGIAGASGVASFAAAPWPIDMGAPAFGASMAAAAASLGSVAMYDVGAWNLSKDQLAMVHSGEMIIPADMAGGMRSLFKGAANGNAPIAANQNGGGDTHIHYSPVIHERERVGLKQLLANDSRTMLEFIHRSVRDGKLKLASA